MFLNYILDQFFIVITLYFLIYNATLFFFFWVILSFFGSLPTYNFSLISLASNNYFKIVVTILLVSLAGVPPFIGFFTKILLINFLINSYSLLNFSIFFLIMILFLYFYTQNLKIIFSNSNKYMPYQFFMYQIKFSKSLPYAINLFIFLLTFSLFFMDDFLLLVNYITI